MRKEQLYHKTVDILVQAYFADTLIHGNQCGCAVGNIVAANCGIRVERDDTQVGDSKISWGNPDKIWQDAAWYGFITKAEPDRKCGTNYSKRKARQQVRSTGYSIDELNEIERAFEQASWGDSEEDYMFNGLMAVIEALDIIHENKDEVVSKSSKQKFTKRELQKIS
jgi:hypothetical protein